MFHVFDVPGDGDCFFHCLSLAIAGNLSNTQYYRQLICGAIENSWHDWKHLVLLHHGGTLPSTGYVEKMVNGKGYATGCEIRAAAIIFQCCITAWRNGFRLDASNNFYVTTYFGEVVDLDKEKRGWKLNLLLDRNHFKVLLPYVHKTRGNSAHLKNQHTPNLCKRKQADMQSNTVKRRKHFDTCATVNVGNKNIN